MRELLPFGSFRIARIFGIPIEINYTWFVIFILVLFSLTFNFRVQYQFSLALSLAEGLFTAILFFSSLILHELSHSYVAKMNKIPIKKITLFIFGGVAQMTEEPKNATSEFVMAVAGPATSLVLSLLYGAIWVGARILNLGSVLEAPFFWLFQINLALAVFNSAPGLPLDGGRVLRATIWYFTGNLARATRIASRSGQGLAYLLIFLGFYLVIGQGQPGGFWLILIGLFLNQAAQASYQQMLFQKSLSGVKVADIMTRDVLTVEPDITLERLVDDYFLKHKFGRFPVAKEGALLGVITLHDVKEVPRDNWPTVTARDVVKPLSDGNEIKPEHDAVHALMKMAREDVGHLLVVDDNGSLVGLVTRSDIIRLIKVKSELET